MVDRQYPAQYSDLRTPLPFLWQRPPPPPCGCDRAWKWWWNNLTVSVVYLAKWANSQAKPNNFNVLSFDSSVTVLRSNRVVGFLWIGLALAFVNKCSRITSIIIIFHHPSSPPVIITILSTLEWKLVVLFLCHGFAKFCSGFTLILFFLLILQNLCLIAGTG